METRKGNRHIEIMTWNAQRLTHTLREFRRLGSDTTLIECKRAGSGAHDDVYESITAFANMPEGGTIVLGVEEKAHFHVSGVADSHKLESQIVHKTRNAINPAPMLNFFPIHVEGKEVLVIEVVALSPSEKPARFHHKAYLRQSDGNYVTNSNDLHILQAEALREKQRIAYDSDIVEGTSTAELDLDILAAFIQSARQKSRQLAKITDDTRLLQVAQVTDRFGQLRLGGLYAMGSSRAQRFQR